MLGTVFCVATAVLGIDVGWEPDAQGDPQIIIQIEPELVPSLLEGAPIEFDLRPEQVSVRHFRIQVGTGKLRDTETLPRPRSTETATRGPDVAAALPAEPKGDRQPPESSASKETGPRSDSIEPSPAGPLDFDFPALPSEPSLEGPSSVSATPTPNRLPDDPGAQAIKEQPATFVEPVGGQKPSSPGDSSSAASDTLMMPMILMSCVAAGLLAALVYLGWIHLGTRRRYHALLADYYAAVGSLPQAS